MRCYRLIKQKDKSSIRLAYLHGADSMIGVTALVLYAIEITLGKQFNIWEKDWKESTQCKAMGAVGIIATESSILATMVIAAERYVIICHPFTASILINKLFIPLNFYCIIAIIFAVVQVNTFTPHNSFCFYFISSITDLNVIVTSTFLMLINLVTISAMLYCTVASLRATYQTRIASGRNASKQDLHLENQMKLCTTVAICNWVLISAFVISWLALEELPPAMTEMYVLFIWPLASLANPIIYTL